MKKLLSTTACLITLVLCVPAQAVAPNENDFFYPYIGFDLQRYSVDYANGLDVAMDNNLNGGNIHIGKRFNKYFGAEFGYFGIEESNKSVNFDISGITGTPGDVLASTDVKMQGITLDGLSYVPINDAGKFKLIGTAGVSLIKADFTLNGTVNGVVGSSSDDQSEFGFRAGAGAQYSFTDQVSLRVLVRYQSMNFDISGFDITNHALIYSTGLNYSF